MRLRTAGHSGHAYELRLGRLRLRVRTGAGRHWYLRGRAPGGTPGCGGVIPLGPGLIWSIGLYPRARRRS